MNEGAALKAVDEAFAEGVRKMFAIFVQGLEADKPDVAGLSTRFRRGLAFHCDAHGKTTAIVADYFRGFK
jgi:hypothetical protein